MSDDWLRRQWLGAEEVKAANPPGAGKPLDLAELRAAFFEGGGAPPEPREWPPDHVIVGWDLARGRDFGAVVTQAPDGTVTVRVLPVTGRRYSKGYRRHVRRQKARARR